MNFSDAVSYISEAENYGIVPGLENISVLCRELSDPQDKLKFIHIAGTNGKGSVGTFLNSILTEAGYKTGRYVSPAVMDYLEKIQICSVNICEEKFAKCTQRVKEAVDRMLEKGYPHPTVFEIETAIAFCCFESEKCDCVLLETGMGGKSDATNIIKNNILTVITSISLEHTQFLGSTIEQIATEKAGIIKPNSNVVTIAQNPKVIDILRNTCTLKSAYLKISKIYNISDYNYQDYIQTFSYNDFKDIKIKMLGKFQTENAVLAIDACKLLADSGFKIENEQIYSGLLNAQWSGRFEIIKDTTPLFIIDGAHNEAAASRLRETIDIYFSDKKIVYIIGTFSDKNYHEIAKLTTKRAMKIYTISTKGKRSLDADTLAKAIKPYNPNVIAMPSISDAIDRSFQEECDVIIAFGSLSFLGEVKRYVNGE
ncbi:MAG: bifunctional folylpolyglutamate synthase/dihydrofolate synthase [Oscillospiraceae bacterium]|nr:bifunctional folylpolyglutamate synthase/dihydrofolate synthase [Oscillospiraceae bacterium]MBQ9982333.1 bifunctional folylpolyglutamate synthase/dihydrofolate synthase [Oscillospiraceae bacterium]